MESQLIKNLKNVKKKVRQQAVEETLTLVIEKKISENELKSLILDKSPDLTSSIIQIMCRAGSETTKILLYWLKEYRDLHNPIMKRNELYHEENVGQRLCYSINKYIKSNIQFQDLYEYLQELHLEAIQIRRELITEIRSSHLEELIDKIDFYFEISKIWGLNAEEQFQRAERMEVEFFFPFTKKLPQGLKEKYLYKLYFYQYWLGLFGDLCFGFVRDYYHPQLIFEIEQILILEEVPYLNLISCPDSRFQRSVLSAIKLLPESNYMVLRNFNFASKDSLWTYINQDRDWFREIPLEQYSNHIASKAIQALLILGDKEALYLFRDICKHFDSKEWGVPFDASRIFTRFTDLEDNVNVDLHGDPNILIGNIWEGLCRKIAKHQFGDITLHPKLPNGYIPDIVLNKDASFKSGKLVKAKCLIECKKSDQFVYRGLLPDRQKRFSEYNNSVTAKYFPYCERLEFWLFENNGLIKQRKIKNQKIVIRYATDFLSEPTLPEDLRNQIQDLITLRDKMIEEEKQRIDPVVTVIQCISDLFSKNDTNKNEGSGQTPTRSENEGNATENTVEETTEKERVNATVTLNKYKKLKRGTEMENKQATEASKLLKVELKEVRKRIKELENMLYEYEELAEIIEENVANLKLDSEIIPEEYIFTGEGKQVFRDIYLKMGLYEIEAQYEGDRYIRIKAKTKSSIALSVMEKQGKCLEHIEKSRLYHIEIDVDTEWKVIMKLVE